MPYGIDLSHYQNEKGPIDWAKLKTSVWKDFAIAKATEGVNLADAYFQANREGAQRAGIPVGAYHFFRPQYDPEQQADFFYKVVGQNIDLIPWIDVEFVNNLAGTTLATATQRLAEMVLYCEQRFGKPIGIYTAPWAWNSLPHNNRFAHLPLWVATWNNQPGRVVYPSGWSSYAIHQYIVDSAPGVTGPVDLNYAPQMAPILRSRPSPAKEQVLAHLAQARAHLEQAEALAKTL